MGLILRRNIHQSADLSLSHSQLYIYCTDLIADLSTNKAIYSYKKGLTLKKYLKVFSYRCKFGIGPNTSPNYLILCVNLDSFCVYIHNNRAPKILGYYFAYPVGLECKLVLLKYSRLSC